MVFLKCFMCLFEEADYRLWMGGPSTSDDGITDTILKKGGNCWNCCDPETAVIGSGPGGCGDTCFCAPGCTGPDDQLPQTIGSAEVTLLSSCKRLNLSQGAQGTARGVRNARWKIQRSQRFRRLRRLPGRHVLGSDRGEICEHLYEVSGKLQLAGSELSCDCLHRQCAGGPTFTVESCHVSAASGSRDALTDTTIKWRLLHWQCLYLQCWMGIH